MSGQNEGNMLQSTTASHGIPRAFVAGTLVAVAMMCSPCAAERIDSFDRADSTVLGTTEAGGFTYVETLTNGQTEVGGKPVDVAKIDGKRLLITGHGEKNPAGRVFLRGYEAADVTVSLKGEFRNSKLPYDTERAKNSLGIMLRTKEFAQFGNGGEGDGGFVTVEFMNTGEVLIRERKMAGKLVSIAPAPKYVAVPGSLGVTRNGLDYDRNDNGVLEEGEPFILSVAVAGKTLTVSVNGQPIFTKENVLEHAGDGTGIALFKGMPSSAFEITSDLLIDDLTVTPLPGPAK